MNLRISLSTARLGDGARQSRAMFHSQPIQLAHVFVAEVLEQVPAHQLLAERRENPLLHLLAADGQTVRAGAAGGQVRLGRPPRPRSFGVSICLPDSPNRTASGR
jgi:hypothetical protein